MASKFANRVKWKGWRPDLPSSKDWRFSLSKDAAAAIPDEYPAPRELHAPVFDQGDLGSCVGVSTSFAVHYLVKTDPDLRSASSYSAMFAYYQARIRDGIKWKDVDAGAYIRDSMDALRDVGIPVESRWPYRQKQFARTPSPSAITAAKRWKLGAHWRCDGQGSDFLDNVLRAISSGYAVVGGFTVFSSLSTQEVDRTGVIPMPTKKDDVDGGHAVFFCGYSKSRRLLEFQNSWGLNWGDHGYGYLPFAYLEDGNLADDFWAMERESPETQSWKQRIAMGELPFVLTMTA